MPTNQRLHGFDRDLRRARRAGMGRQETQDAARAPPAARGGSRRPRTHHHRGRHHRVPAGERPARAPVPGPDQADHHGQHHLPRRLAPRELRRNRHGAPARTHGVQGLAEPQGHSQRVDVARRASQRHHFLGSHQLLRDLQRHRGEPALGARPRVRPHGQFVHRQEGSRQRDDRGAQRIRRRREPARQRDVQAAAVRRLRLAQLRQHADRRALRHRGRAHRATAGVLPDLLPARQRHRCWWPGRSTKPPRWRWSTSISDRFRVPRACCPSCTRSSRRRTASARWSCAASATCRWCGTAYHIPAGRS